MPRYNSGCLVMPCGPSLLCLVMPRGSSLMCPATTRVAPWSLDMPHDSLVPCYASWIRDNASLVAMAHVVVVPHDASCYPMMLLSLLCLVMRRAASRYPTMPRGESWFRRAVRVLQHWTQMGCTCLCTHSGLGLMITCCTWEGEALCCQRLWRLPQGWALDCATSQ